LKVWRRVSILGSTGLQLEKTPRRMFPWPKKGCLLVWRNMQITSMFQHLEPTLSRNLSQSIDYKKAHWRRKTASNLTIFTEIQGKIGPLWRKRAWTSWRWNRTRWSKRRLFSARWGRWRSHWSIRKWWRVLLTVVVVFHRLSITTAVILGWITVLIIPVTEELTIQGLRILIKLTLKSNRFCHVWTRMKNLNQNTAKKAIQSDHSFSRIRKHQL